VGGKTQGRTRNPWWVPKRKKQNTDLLTHRKNKKGKKKKDGHNTPKFSWATQKKRTEGKRSKKKKSDNSKPARKKT